jgi:hypothetical protein
LQLVDCLHLEPFPALANSFDQLAESAVGSKVCQRRIVPGEERIVDESPLDGDFEPVQGPIGIAEQGEAVCQEPREHISGRGDSLDFRRQRRERSSIVRLVRARLARDHRVGMIQRSTDIVELSGDLKGRVLYHPTSIFDFVNGTLVNTGHQVFSGTILGSAPVMLYDDEFRFEVNLVTATESGEIHLTDRLAGPKIACDLMASGTGVKTPEGNALVDYAGTCTLKK